MRLSKLVRNMPYGIKLNLVVALAVATLLVANTVVTARSVSTLTLQIGRQRAVQEAGVIGDRFREAEQRLLDTTKVLSASPGLLEAVVSRHAAQARNVLSAAAPLELDVIALVDADGVPITTLTQSVAMRDVATGQALLAASLEGLETAGLASHDPQTGHRFLLAAAVPVRDSSGRVVGALLGGRDVDDAFMAEINFDRDNVHLFLIHDEQLIARHAIHRMADGEIMEHGAGTHQELMEAELPAQEPLPAMDNGQTMEHGAGTHGGPMEGEMPTEEPLPTVGDAIEFAGIKFEGASVEQALGGETVVVDTLLYSSDDVPHSLVYAPLALGSETSGVIGILIRLDMLFLFRRQLTVRTTATFLLLALVAAGTVALFARRTISVPLARLKRAAESMARGEFAERAEVKSTDEVGQLALAFNSMADQLGASLTELEQRTRVIATTAAVSRRLSKLLDREQLVAEVVEQLRSAFDYYHVHIYLLEPGGANLMMVGGSGEVGAQLLARGHSIPLGKGLVGRAAETNRVVLVPDVSQEAGWLPNPLLPETKSEVAVPIATSDQVLGVLDVQQNVVAGLTRADAELLEAIAGQVAIALQNAGSYEQARRRAQREALLGEIGHKIQTTTTVEDTLQVAVRELGRALGARRASVQLQLTGGPKNGDDAG